MQKRFQVFVSSTFKDLEEERKEVMQVLLELNYFPAGMEIFPAADENQLKYIHQIIDDSDFYILIIAGKYGSTNSDGISYTELEFDYALEKKKPILAFIYQDITSLSISKSETDIVKQTNLLKFKEKVQKDRLTKYWKNKDDLAAKVSRTLNHAVDSYPATGWIRSDSHIETATDYNSDVKLIEKIIYYKFIHLSNQKINKQPLYKKFIKRLNQEIDVYDEYLTFRISHFSKLVKKFKSYDSTKGSAVEVMSLLPFVLNLRDTDFTVEDNPRIIQPTIMGPSHIYVTSSHYYNGFQDGNKDSAIKADKETETMRLIVDFSSISNFGDYISSEPQVFYCYLDLESGKLVNKLIGPAKKISPGVFYAEMKNLIDGEVLKIEFADDFNTTSNIS